MLCCAEHCRCESSRVTSPLDLLQIVSAPYLLYLVIKEMSRSKVQHEHHREKIFIAYRYPAIHTKITASEGICQNL